MAPAWCATAMAKCFALAWRNGTKTSAVLAALLKQLPMPKPRSRASSTKMNADERLRADEAAMEEEMRNPKEFAKKQARKKSNSREKKSKKSTSVHH